MHYTEGEIGSRGVKWNFMIKKLLIANRGEIACRIIQTAKKMNIYTVAVYSEIEENALHTQLADERCCIGPAPSISSYLNRDKIISIAKSVQADAIHPGYGFLSEDAEFAQQCQQAGIRFVGPSPQAIHTMGDKNLAKTTMIAAGVPVVPGYQEDMADLAAVQKAVNKIGLPIIIKASAGGGGKGMRLVENLSQLDEALQGAMREAQASFGDSRVFLEKYLAQARHVEVQILFDQYGHGIYLFDRDCSIQRRHQKVIEEAPAPRISDATRKKMARTALRAGEAIQYSSTGTIEFLVDENENYYFMEMNTRLQVEHPVTEMITNLDLVEWQLRIAAGEKLTIQQTDVNIQGHAIEARLYAENPQNHFMPSPGMLHYFRLPNQRAPEIRVDSGFRAGDRVSVYYDPLLAKLVAWGKDRAAAIKTLQAMLHETAVAGVHTNWSLLNRIACNPEFIHGGVTTQFIAQQHAQLFPNAAPTPDSVIAVACLAFLWHQQQEQQQQQLQASPWLAGDSWRLEQPAERRISFWHAGKYWQIAATSENSDFKFCCGQHVLSGTVNWRDNDQLTIAMGGQVVTAIIFMDTDELIVFCVGEQWLFSLLNPAALSGASPGESGLKAPMPGTLIEICVESGQIVHVGDRLLVIEAMKMEHVVLAPHGGKIQTIYYQAGDRVNAGAPLIEFSNESENS